MAKVRLVRLAALTSALSFSAILPASADGEIRPPVEAFAALPAMSQPVLSPDGRRIVVLRTLGDAQHAFVTDLGSGRSNPVLGADPSRFFINFCRWASNQRILCSIRSYGELKSGRNLYFYREGRATFTRLIAVDADGSNQLMLVPEPVNRELGALKWNAVDQDNVVSWLPDDPEHILLALNRDDRLRPSVYRLNIYSNKLTRIRKYHDSVFRWYADAGGNLRFAVGYENDTPAAFNVSDRRLKRLDVTRYAALDQPRVLSLSADGSEVYFGTYYDGEYYRYLRADTLSGELIGTLFEDPQHDLFGGGLVRHPRTREGVLIQYFSEQRERYWLDDEYRSRLEPVFQTLEKLHTDVRVISLAANAATAIFVASGKGTAPTYYVYDHPTRNLQRLLATYPDIPQIVDFEIVSYETRDGWPITAYLARPQGEGPFPTVIFPHGGPNLRDYPVFDYWTQFFVSRGYAVIKPNFRGSVGYGISHLSAGFEQWGLRMQDDVIDALDWMIAAEIADPERVCVVGGSYGGYVALVAAFKTPERIRCAVSFAGVSDLDELKTHWRYFELGELSVARIQPGRSARDNSPIRQVERIDVPLLIAHGDADRAVMIEQSRELVAALERAGKPYRYIEQPDGDHYLSNQSHRIQFFEAMDSFLATHLSAQAQP